MRVVPHLLSFTCSNPREVRYLLLNLGTLEHLATTVTTDMKHAIILSSWYYKIFLISPAIKVLEHRHNTLGVWLAWRPGVETPPPHTHTGTIAKAFSLLPETPTGDMGQSSWPVLITEQSTFHYSCSPNGMTLPPVGVKDYESISRHKIIMESYHSGWHGGFLPIFLATLPDIQTCGLSFPCEL